MDLATFRKSRKLTQEQLATELGLSARSKGWISEIESGARPASARLAFKIERWSGGVVKAASLSEIAADIARTQAA